MNITTPEHAELEQELEQFDTVDKARIAKERRLIEKAVRMLRYAECVPRSGHGCRRR